MSKMRKPNQAETQALNEGDAAARAGKTVDACPYRDAIGLRFMWVTGHQNAMSDIESARKRQQEAEDKKKLEAFPSLLAERDSLLAALDEAQKDANRYRWLRDHKCNSLHLSRDGDHACNYMTASDWIDNNPDWYDEVPAEELQRMRDANTIWNLQIYPHTPVGFNWWHGATLDAAIDAAIAAQEGGK